MEKNSKIYIAGHTGLVGSAIHRKLLDKGYENFVFSPYPKYDLREQSTVEQFFKTKKPEYVILAAAKVGGIMANNTYRAQFIYENLQIQNNIIHQSYKHGVKKLLFLGSSCIYPKLAPQPLKEDYLLTDTLEYTNEPYAIAKIAGIKMCESYNLQYGTNFIAVMPTNLYGPNDNFDLEKSHVLPALIRKMHLAKCLENNDFDAVRNDLRKMPVGQIDENAGQNEILEMFENHGIKNGETVTVELWGSGKPRREFLHSNDLADACAFLMENTDFKDILKHDFGIISPSIPLTDTEVRNTHINIGTGKDITIKELAEIVKSITGFKGRLTWNTELPDGTPQKLLDVSKLKSYGWQPQIPFRDGIEKVYEHYAGNGG